MLLFSIEIGTKDALDDKILARMQTLKEQNKNSDVKSDKSDDSFFQDFDEKIRNNDRELEQGKIIVIKIFL
jgi:hypothetical protein